MSGSKHDFSYRMSRVFPKTSPPDSVISYSDSVRSLNEDFAQKPDKSDIFSADQHVSIYPNPSEGIYNVILPAGNNFDEIRIYDVLGNVIKRVSVLSDVTTVNISGHPKGVYIFGIYNHQTQVIERLVLK